MAHSGCGSWRIEVHRRVQRVIRRSPGLRARLDEVVEELRRNPYTAADKVLRGNCAGVLSRRLGDYRILYRVDPDTCTVLIDCVGPRERVYEECC